MPELPEPVTQVLRELLNEVPSPHFPAPLPGHRDVAEPPPGRIVSFLGRHAGFPILLLLHLEMGANLFLEVVNGVATEKFREHSPPAHGFPPAVGARTPVIALTNRSQREVSATSFFRPAGVRR